jgi:protein tyrosine phosphatase
MHGSLTSYAVIPQSIRFFFRVKNILPYDGNVVKLKVPIDDMDYINASFIANPGFGPPKEIACQAPLTNTLVHFCQMLVEQKVDVIIMLTKCHELKKDG